MNKLRSKFSDVPFLKTSFTIYKRQETVIVSSILATRTIDDTITVSLYDDYMFFLCCRCTEIMIMTMRIPKPNDTKPRSGDAVNAPSPNK